MLLEHRHDGIDYFPTHCHLVWKVITSSFGWLHLKLILLILLLFLLLLTDLEVLWPIECVPILEQQVNLIARHSDQQIIYFPRQHSFNYRQQNNYNAYVKSP